MLSADRDLTVYAAEPALLTGLPKRRCMKYVRKPSAESLLESTYVFVLTSLLNLENVAEVVRQANQRHHLRAFFVCIDDGSDFLPQILNNARLRTIRYMFVHQGTDVPRRVLNAFCIGAEHDLIANARLVGDELMVVDCASDMLRVKVDDVRALRNTAQDQLSDFTIADDGSYLHWPATDVHLGLEDLKILVDPNLRERVEAEKLLQSERIGTSIRTLRRSCKLTQASIPGVSERQVRRIENGATTSVSALRKLARAHGMSLTDYVNEIARIASSAHVRVGQAGQSARRRLPKHVLVPSSE